MTEQTLLQFSNLIFRYSQNDPRVLSNLDLSIRQGDCTVILGPNGAGKTTLLQLALGWLKPNQGEILLNGKSLSTYGRQELGQNIALVPQIENTSYDYSLLDYVLLGRAPYLPPLGMPGEADYQFAQDALEKVGMGKLANRSILQMSGGEKQMALLARALAQQPRLLLLDEPSAHLDLGNKYRLVEVIRQLVLLGVTILMTTHEPDLASAVANHLVLMRSGEVIQAGALAECMTSAWMSRLYNQPIKVIEAENRRWVVWA